MWDKAVSFLSGKCRGGRTLALVISLSAVTCACAPSDLLDGIAAVEPSPPSFECLSAVSPRELSVSFSEPVSIRSCRFSPDLALQTIIDGAAEVQIILDVETSAGARYGMDLEAEDADGNTLALYCTFRGHNNRVPSLILNEVRLDYSKPKVEFLELSMLEAGNLGGVEVYTASAGEDPLFIFPPVELRAGELVVLHLRSIEDGLVNETEGIDISSGVDASASARDFWIDGSSKRIRKTDVIVVRERRDGPCLDCLPVTEDLSNPWPNEEMTTVINTLIAEGSWSGGPVSSQGSTTTRTLCRYAETGISGSVIRSASQWRIVPTGGATPGGANVDGVYEPSTKRVKARPATTSRVRVSGQLPLSV